jgi:hypothetical protein
MLLLKTTRYKTSFVALKRTIRAGFNIINPLTSDRTNMCGNRYKVSCASALKSSNLRCHSMLPLLMMNGITVRSQFRKNSTSKTKLIWRPNRPSITKSISWRTSIRSCLIKRRRCIKRGWLIKRRRRIRRWLRNPPSMCVDTCDKRFTIISIHLWNGLRKRRDHR